MSQTGRCPTCGSAVKVVGNTTQHYEPVYTEATLAQAVAKARADAFKEIYNKMLNSPASTWSYTVFNHVADGAALPKATPVNPASPNKINNKSMRGLADAD